MVHRRDGLVRTPNLEAALAKTGERLGRSHLVNELQVDVEDRRPVRLLNDDMLVPNLLK
jgi:hypothetical protein